MESRKDFKWTVYAVSVVSLLLVCLATYFIIMLVSSEIKVDKTIGLALIFLTGFITVVVVSAMFLGLTERKCETCQGCAPGRACNAPPPPPVEPVKTRKPRTPKVQVQTEA